MILYLDFSFDVIGITETRLYDDHPLTNIEINGYDFVHTPTSTKCGGAGIYIKSIYDYEIKSELSCSLPNVSESIFIEIKRKKLKNLIVGCVYRHHCHVSTFLESYFLPTLDKINRILQKTIPSSIQPTLTFISIRFFIDIMPKDLKNFSLILLSRLIF